MKKGHQWIQRTLVNLLSTGANQIKVVPYEWSACDSPSSSPPLFEPVHQPCADPRPEKDSLCNQSVAPFMSSELFKREGNHKRRRQEDCSLYTRTGPLWRMGEILTPAGCITGLSVWFSFSDQLSPAVGESQNSQNAMLPKQSECASWGLGDIRLSVTS